jgi:hypothetical protein
VQADCGELVGGADIEHSAERNIEPIESEVDEVFDTPTLDANLALHFGPHHLDGQAEVEGGKDVGRVPPAAWKPSSFARCR